MKKSISLIALALMVFSGVFFTGCKKGEDDPFISFKSRDARITAKWKLVNYESLESGTNSFTGSTYTTTVSYNGTLLTTTSTNNGTDIVSYTVEMEILKGGEYTYNEVRDGSVEYGKDTWYWFNNTENKGAILLQGNFGGIFQIDRLSSSELVLSANSEDIQTFNGVSYPQKSSLKLTFEKAD
jgi:hypothetical protein